MYHGQISLAYTRINTDANLIKLRRGSKKPSEGNINKYIYIFFFTFSEFNMPNSDFKGFDEAKRNNLITFIVC